MKLEVSTGWSTTSVRNLPQLSSGNEFTAPGFGAREAMILKLRNPLWGFLWGQLFGTGLRRHSSRWNINEVRLVNRVVHDISSKLFASAFLLGGQDYDTRTNTNAIAHGGTASSTETASSKFDGARCAYRIVIFKLECPSKFETLRRGTPF